MPDQEGREAEVAVIGGGPAGLTAALYAARLGHSVAVVDRGGGRAAMMRNTHNVIGVSEETPGVEILENGVERVEEHGGEVVKDTVAEVRERDGEDGFQVVASDHHIRASRVVFATGFTDVPPDPPAPQTGKGLFYCLYCDAYLLVDEPAYVMGHDAEAAHLAMSLLHFTDDVDLLLRGEGREWGEDVDRQLRAHPIDVVEPEIEAVETDDDDWLEAFAFEDGEDREYTGGFAAYGTDHNNDLAADLGCAVRDDGTLVVDQHGRTTVDGVYAVGDLTPGYFQVSEAMAQGTRAGIAIHHGLSEFPKSLSEIEESGGVSEDATPGAADVIREHAAEHEIE